jgi:hypothetical protein
MGQFQFLVISRIVTTIRVQLGRQKRPTHIESDVGKKFCPFEAAYEASLHYFSLWGLALAKYFELKFANKSLITARYWVYLFIGAVKMSANTLLLIVPL